LLKFPDASRLAKRLLSSSGKVSACNSHLMNRSHPTCDRHPNLQMVPCWVQRAGSITAAHVCPVPVCSRYHVDGVFLEASEVELVLGPKMAPKPDKNQKPLNRQAAARAAILKAIEHKQRS
jgi:hypothetical protein